MPDPRVYFAAERTLLAWIRTSLTVMALGFVIARFGLFIELLSLSKTSAKANPTELWSANLLGIALICVGVFIIFAAYFNHRKFVQLLPQEDVPESAVSWLSSFLSLALGLVGICLMAYLGFSI